MIYHALKNEGLINKTGAICMGKNFDGPRNPVKHHRRSIRLRGYDYSQAGAYFVTLCAYNKEYLFGDIINSVLRMNKYGKTVREKWLLSSKLRSEIKLDEFVIMPNHFHAIVIIWGIGTNTVGANGRSPLRMKPKSLSSLMAGFKSSATSRINGLRNSPGVPVWQRNYYEHIVRNEEELNRIREYIINNPLQWQFDRENPRRTPDKAYEDHWGYLEEAIYGKVKNTSCKINTLCHEE